MNAAYEIERLLQFGHKHGLVKGLDVIVARNQLLDLFRLDAPYEGEVPEEEFEYPTQLLEGLLDLAAGQGLFDNSVYNYRVNFEARIMGCMMPGAQETARRFEELFQTQGAKAATDWFYKLCIDSNYIRTAQIAQNIQWSTSTPYGELEITINLTKPEKDPKTIALEKLQPQTAYPKCMLCRENIGYAGRINFPARQTHRIVPVKLCGEQWYFQYSPYVYFNEHCIILCEEHTPMEMDRRTLAKIMDFVQQFPHYTCGSNADLPIVGGSILSHSHFQGGSYEFPMTRATLAAPLHCTGHEGVRGGILNWPVSTIRPESHDPDALLAAAGDVLEAWAGYTDESVGILARSGEVRHNTVTPILHFDGERGYVMDLALRNNRTSEEYPDGIFHPHPEWHNIKKENIGLIEVMGLAILPCRLKEQSAAVCRILCGAEPNTSREESSPLAVHADWIDGLIAKYGTALTPGEAEHAVRGEIGLVFSHVLEDAGVFKQTDEGRAAFARFAACAGLAEG
ncbi:MAG: UDP-glucose--hexose-1-phosphate uridylyltransferase [Oscillospiraceae bacterium]|nr:UDP-glucose--hexose-1-phosphate uridylyltransferase [Oscillospiraceae bacterium]